MHIRRQLSVLCVTLALAACSHTKPGVSVAPQGVGLKTELLAEGAAPREKLRYDLYYIKHQSLAFDFTILIDTVKVVLFGKGAQ